LNPKNGRHYLDFSMHFLFVSSVLAQAGCEQTNIVPCKNDAEIFRTATCEPMAARNQTHYQHCLCYHFVNLQLCYLQCTSPAAQAELQGQAIPQTTAQCGAAGLNPRALPQPPIWQTWFPTTAVARPTAATVVPGNTASPAATGSNLPKANTAYQAVQTGFMVSLAFLAGMML
jgi:hypothetical protein